MEIINTTDNAPIDPEAAIRVAARHLANAAQPTDALCSQQLKVDIARLTASDDPNTIDTESPAFRAGAALALSSVLNGLYEQFPAPRRK